MIRNMPLPTVLTWLRIVLVPFFVGVYYLPDYLLTMPSKNILATAIFTFAAITDYFDGYLARKMKLESSFGAFLDPVADKALVAASLVVLVNLHRTFVFAAIIIIVREIAISALREWMAQIGEVKSVAVAYIGKLKTTCQMLAIGFLLLDFYTNLIGNLLMLAAVILTLISMFYYLEQAKNILIKKSS
ncbi:MAG TPA: CDP-diacylglycerol--glycerol-3-phosphate 3-phosphatidyltransferase [Burkholderiales bacterium]|jgi:CDP-diacylglycerol--glycerol-3-phosphate 3-phosphatidyltransferase|nr:CDP-diacylglycerol--glycerol-3-phosphate 3-phosphatidyltransferase [Burkholderiales bacterium]